MRRHQDAVNPKETEPSATNCAEYRTGMNSSAAQTQTSRPNRTSKMIPITFNIASNTVKYNHLRVSAAA